MNLWAHSLLLSPAPAGLIGIDVDVADAASERLPGRIGDELAFGAAGAEECPVLSPGLGIGAEQKR
jgi:hypothetical protein